MLQSRLLLFIGINEQLYEDVFDGIFYYFRNLKKKYFVFNAKFLYADYFGNYITDLLTYVTDMFPLKEYIYIREVYRM